MTLNITVATHRCIYQCADYRFTVAGQPLPDLDTNQKIVVCNRLGWHATVCYNGVAFTRSIHVGSWLESRLDNIKHDDPLERLYEELMRADDWLKDVEDQRHTFCVGAINGTMPVVALITNYEWLGAPPAPRSRGSLEILEFKPQSPTTFVAGQPGSISRPIRRRLARLADERSSPDVVFDELARANRSVASGNAFVSAACFTTYVDRAGAGRGQPHGIDVRVDSPLARANMLGLGESPVIRKIIKKQFPGGAVLREIAITRGESTEEFHRIQLIEKPIDPDVHANHGAYLCDVKGDLDGAERAYRRALQLNSAHTNALGNLANLLLRRGQVPEAEVLYRKALTRDPVDLNVTLNMVRFQRAQCKPIDEINSVIERGLRAHPTSAPLHVMAAQNCLLTKQGAQALEHIRVARDQGGAQQETEVLFAVALFMSGAGTQDCVAAYRTAIALDPESAALKLNLAQLVFIAGDKREALGLLRKSLAGGLDPSAEIEAHFYRLAHTDDDVAGVLKDMQRAVEVGGRLDWNLLPTIQSIEASRPLLGEWLGMLRRVLLECTEFVPEHLIRSYPPRELLASSASK